MFEKIKAWYTAGIWNKKMVGDAVAKGKLTAEEYREITGEEYQEEIVEGAS